MTNATPNERLFDKNLQVFATQVGILCGLEHHGDIPQEDIIKRIDELFVQLKASRNLESN